jgi:hypothetical protein
MTPDTEADSPVVFVKAFEDIGLQNDERDLEDQENDQQCDEREKEISL